MRSLLAVVVWMYWRICRRRELEKAARLLVKQQPPSLEFLEVMLYDAYEQVKEEKLRSLMRRFGAFKEEKNA